MSSVEYREAPDHGRDRVWKYHRSMKDIKNLYCAKGFCVHIRPIQIFLQMSYDSTAVWENETTQGLPIRKWIAHQIWRVVQLYAYVKKYVYTGRHDIE